MAISELRRSSLYHGMYLFFHFLHSLGKLRKVQTTEELMADLKERTASEIEGLRRVAKNATKENPLSNLTKYEKK